MNAEVRFLLDLLEALFVIGAIGSALVLILSGIEDTRTVFASNESEAEHD